MSADHIDQPETLPTDGLDDHQPGTLLNFINSISYIIMPVVNSREIFLKSIPPQVSERDVVEAINLKIGTGSISGSFVTQRRQIGNTVKSLKITLKNPELAKKIVDEKSLQVKDSLIEVSYYVDLREKHADNDTSKPQTKAPSQDLILPGPGNLIVSGRPLNNFLASEDVYKVFSQFGKLSNAVLKNSKSSEKIVFLEFVNKESARQAISDLNDKPLPSEFIRRLKLQTVKKDAEGPDAHYYQDTDFIGGEEFNIEKIYQQDPSLAKDTLKVGYISDKQQQPHSYPRTSARTNTQPPPTQTQPYEDTNQNGQKFLPTLHILGLTPLYDEAYLKEKIENIAGKDSVQFVRIDNRNKNEHYFRKARVAMKRREDGNHVIERQYELQPLKVEWFVPPPDRNAQFSDNSRTSTTNTSVSSGDELKLQDNSNPLNDHIQQMIQQMSQPLMQGSIPQGFNNNFGLSNSAPLTNPPLYNMMNPIASLFNNPGYMNGAGIGGNQIMQPDIHNIQQPSVNQGQQMFNQYGINQQQQSIQYPQYNMNQGIMGNNYSSFNQQQNPGGPQANRYNHHQQNYQDRNQYNNNRQYNNNFQGNYPNQRQGGQDSQPYQKRDYPNRRQYNNQRPGQYGKSAQHQQQPPQSYGQPQQAFQQPYSQQTQNPQQILPQYQQQSPLTSIQQPNHPNQQINQSPIQPQPLHQQVQPNVNSAQLGQKQFIQNQTPININDPALQYNQGNQNSILNQPSSVLQVAHPTPVNPPPVNPPTQNGNQTNFDLSSLSQGSDEDKKNSIGEFIYEYAAKDHEELAGKITGMILELDLSELKQIVQNKQILNKQITDAILLLQQTGGGDAE
ncbi:MAG: hypothetical protein EZS28_000573 [Streblomastix strix]|uniref:Polyadenylate-binding protein, cytoplasmic and nuclear n=1 Tax=Streblomastix strix TaxID=222440 RepID=A0A5J4X9V8_9EUKA|nr:MAG: hypothetical protein EZS28_000573 [Streblomastix strix]